MGRVNVLKIVLLCLAVPILVYAFDTGAPQAHTGGFGEPTCTECHVGIALNSGPGRVTVTVNAPSGYASGVTYPVTVTVSDPNQRRWGFELSARTQGGQQAGTLIAGPDGFTQLLLDFGGIQYITHTSAGTRPGTPNGASFNFSWRAPATSAGPVVFNVAGNAADNRIYGAGGPDYVDGGAGDDLVAGGRTQVVYLDFDSKTNQPPGSLTEHIYTPDERNAIEAFQRQAHSFSVARHKKRQRWSR